MTQLARNPVPVHRRPHGFADHQSDPRTGQPVARFVTSSVDHQIGLCAAGTLLDGGGELRRPTHSVLRGKHGSSSQRLTALAAPTGHDGPTRASPHPQPEAMNPCPATVVGLERPLALGHGAVSLLPAGAPVVRIKRIHSYAAVRSLVLLLTGAVPVAGRSRIATFGRPFEGTDRRCRGQTWDFSLP